MTVTSFIFFALGATVLYGGLITTFVIFLRNEKKEKEKISHVA